MAPGRARTGLAIAYLALFLAPVCSERVFSSSTGTIFGRNSREPKYKITFHPANSHFHPYDGQESMIMSNTDGKKYTCYLPLVEETKPRIVNEHNISGILVGTDRPMKLKTPDEVLDVLKDQCLIRHEGWWTYEFCYHKRIRQFHLDDSKITQDFILGEYDSEATSTHNQNHSDTSTLKDPRFKDASQRYHAHLYTNGTLCDLTNEPRETEIRFVCSEATMITSVKEISTCKYAVTVQCSMLCKHPLFQQEKPAWHTIHCNEQQAEGEASEYNASKEKQVSVLVDGIGRYAT